jgi:YidC/Oxa1 family membrane protein insertase
MENRRFILICLFGVLLFFIWRAWTDDQARMQDAQHTPMVEREVPRETDDQLPSPPVAPAEMVAESADPVPAAPGAEQEPPGAQTGTIKIETDVIRAEISLNGGDLRKLELLNYPESRARPQPLPLLDDDVRRWSVIQSGVLAAPSNPATQHTPYRADVREVRLADGEDYVEVTLTARTELPYAVEKTYRFERGRYTIALRHSVSNQSEQSIDASLFTQIWRTDHTLGDEPPFAPTFTGYGLYEERDNGRYRFRKISFGDIRSESERIEQNDGWLSMMQHYFIIAMLPEPGQRVAYSARPSQVRGYLAQATGSPVTLAPGATHDFDTRLYVGPKLQSRLSDIAPGFDLVIDYGILTPLSAPLFWVLNQIHRFVGNWGLAIILLTLGVKLAMYKLSEAQFRSFAKMRLFAPRIQDLRERYGDDRQRLNQAMMDLYKKEGFNPLGGCLPMLVQFPVFIALYWVLLESVELRQAPFIGWITDLSVPDPFYILPLLFGVSMWAQQKLSGQMAAMEPMQQRIMMAMPIMLTAFFTLFPAGLVLYWLVSNLVGIAQQWYINRKLDREGLGKKKPA